MNAADPKERPTVNPLRILTLPVRAGVGTHRALRGKRVRVTNPPKAARVIVQQQPARVVIVHHHHGTPPRPDR